MNQILSEIYILDQSRIHELNSVLMIFDLLPTRGGFGEQTLSRVSVWGYKTGVNGVLLNIREKKNTYIILEEKIVDIKLIKQRKIPKATLPVTNKFVP